MTRQLHPFGAISTQCDLRLEYHLKLDPGIVYYPSFESELIKMRLDKKLSVDEESVIRSLGISTQVIDGKR